MELGHIADIDVIQIFRCNPCSLQAADPERSAPAPPRLCTEGGTGRTDTPNRHDRHVIVGFDCDFTFTLTLRKKYRDICRLSICSLNISGYDF